MTVKELIQQLTELQKLSPGKDLPVRVTDTNHDVTAPVHETLFDSYGKEECAFLVLRGVQLNLDISDEV